MFRIVRNTGGGKCELERKTLHRIPVLESIPDVHPQREDLTGDSPGQKVNILGVQKCILIFYLVI